MCNCHHTSFDKDSMSIELIPSPPPAGMCQTWGWVGTSGSASTRRCSAAPSSPSCAASTHRVCWNGGPPRGRPTWPWKSDLQTVS